MAEKNETTEKVTKTRELLEFHSPAAMLAASRGEETRIIVIPKRYPKENYRFLCVNNNPACNLPTGEEVEVALDEYYEIKNSIDITRANEKESAKLEAEFRKKSRYF